VETRVAWVCAMSLLGFAFGSASQTQEAASPQAAEANAPDQGASATPALAVEPTQGAPTLSLTASVAVALDRNLALLSAGDSVSAAKAREDAARGQFLPRVTPSYMGGSEQTVFGLEASQRLPWSGGSLTASGTLRSLHPADGPRLHASDLELVLSQPLLRGAGPNATYFDLRNSRRAREAQERAFELARQRLVVDVTTSFYQVVKQRELLNVARQGLQRSADLRQASEARMKVGLASKLDVFRAELQSSQTEEALVQAQSGLETALEQFRILLGLDPADPVEPEAVTLPDTVAMRLEPISVLVATAVESRLEVREARDQVKDAERAAAIARQNLLPQLDLNVGVTQAGIGPTYGDSLRAADSRVSFFVSSSYPVERSADKAARAVAELDLASRRRAAAQLELEVAGEVRAAARSLERLEKSIELQRKGVDFAGQQHRLATLRYQRGLASNFDVVDAESNLLSSRTALVSLLTDYQVARVQLLKAIGKLDVAKEAGR
jgi:outer membrane protein